jgi:hypothetical protein
MTTQEMELKIKALEAQLQSQSTAKASKLTVKHSIPRAGDDTHKAVKGGTVGLYGVNGQFPISAYPGQWLEIAAFMPTVIKYIQDNADVIVAAQPVKKADGTPNDKIVPANDLRVKAAQYLASLPKVA